LLHKAHRLALAEYGPQLQDVVIVNAAEVVADLPALFVAFV